VAAMWRRSWRPAEPRRRVNRSNFLNFLNFRGVRNSPGTELNDSLRLKDQTGFAGGVGVVCCS
jgi:hypothetical protein